MKKIIVLQAIIIAALSFVCFTLIKNSRSAETRQFVNPQTAVDQQRKDVPQTNEDKSPVRNEEAKDNSAATASKPKSTDTSNIVSVRISDVINENPEYAELYNKEVRWRILREYGPSIMSLGLTKEQSNHLKELLVTQRQIENDTTAIARQSGVNSGSTLHQAAVNKTTQEVRNEIIELIGEENYNDLRQANSINKFEEQVNVQIGPALLDAGVPLDANVKREIAKVFATTKGLSSTQANIPDPVTGLSEADNILLEKIAPLVDDEQLAVIREVRLVNHRRQKILAKYVPPGATWTLVP